MAFDTEVDVYILAREEDLRKGFPTQYSWGDAHSAFERALADAKAYPRYPEHGPARARFVGFEDIPESVDRMFVAEGDKVSHFRLEVTVPGVDTLEEFLEAQEEHKRWLQKRHDDFTKAHPKVFKPLKK